MWDWLNRFFEVEKRHSTIGREVHGAVTTFLTMAYILFANWAVLRPALEPAGISVEAVVTATAAAAGICSLLMGLVANFPIALASGMGLNAVVAGLVTSRQVENWQTAMGLVVLDGIIILILVLAGLRETMLRAIPRDLRIAIGAGIGLFIAFIGIVNARIAVVPSGTLFVLSRNPDIAMPPVTHGSLSQLDTVVAVVGLIVTAYLLTRRVRGAILIGIVLSTLLAALFGLVQWQGFEAPSFATVGQADLAAACQWRLAPLLLALLMVDFFDTLGTVTAIAEQGKLHEDGQIPRLRQILTVDSVSASIGGFFGVSSVTSYLETAAGVAEGARTGLHAVVVGILFLAAILIAPLVALVPAAATAPALIIVGFLMAAHMADINFHQLETAIPAFVTIITVPFTYSIAHGVGYGLITYVAIQVLLGKYRNVHPIMYAVAGLFVAYFVWGKA